MTATVQDAYVRAVDVVKVIDGDTFRCDVDLGFYVRARMSCRLVGLNCAELDQPGGAEARQALLELLGRGPVSVRSVRADKFAGRFDAVVLVAASGRLLVVNDELIAAGVAVAWDGHGPRPVVPWPPASG